MDQTRKFLQIVEGKYLNSPDSLDIHKYFYDTNRLDEISDRIKEEIASGERGKFRGMNYIGYVKERMGDLDWADMMMVLPDEFSEDQVDDFEGKAYDAAYDYIHKQIAS